MTPTDDTAPPGDDRTDAATAGPGTAPDGAAPDGTAPQGPRPSASDGTAPAPRPDAPAAMPRPDPATLDLVTHSRHLGMVQAVLLRPFRVGFIGAAGALTAIWLVGLLGSITSQLTMLVVAFFLALGLDPMVRFLQRRGLSRRLAVAVVFLGVVGLLAGFISLVVPTVVEQATLFTAQLPSLVDDLQKSAWLRQLDARYDVVDTVVAQATAKLQNASTIMQLFGGVFGAGRAVVSGAFSTFTLMILTLYFLASLRPMIESCYRLVPASRRPVVRDLTEEILRRIGGYIAGQVGVATINGVCMLVLLTVLGLDYAAVLALVTGIFGLVPLVGATLGAVVVAVVALFNSWQACLIVVVYVLLYQQAENYLIAPRIMSRTVSVPGSVALVAALVGGSLMGVVGALIAIPVAAAIMLVVERVVVPRQQLS